MNVEQLSDDDGRLVRRYEYDDCEVVVADLGVTDATVDVVGDVAIVVAGDEQIEIDLPSGDEVQAFIRNGVLSIEVMA